MPELLTSRAFLLDAIRAAGAAVRTSDAERMLSDSAWSCHRNTARKRLRSLAGAGLLVAGVDADGRTVYTPASGTEGRS